MLGSMKIVSFVPTRDPKNARSFYEDVLGLQAAPRHSARHA